MLKFSFIGMSGAGKSHWSQKLATAGFRVIRVDDRIEQKLAPELAAGGHRGIGGVAAWMGWPDQPAYREREQEYLAREVESMTEALNEIEVSGDEGIKILFARIDTGNQNQCLATVSLLGDQRWSIVCQSLVIRREAEIVAAQIYFAKSPCWTRRSKIKSD